MQPSRSLSRSAFFAAAGFEGGLALLAWGVGSATGTPAFGRFRLDAAGVLWGVAASLPMIALFFVFMKWPVGPMRGIREKLDEVFVPFFKHCTWDELAALALLAGIGEEALFRGLLQTGLEGWMTPVAALVVAGILFGLAHLVTVTYAVLAGIVGLYLGWLYLETGNLLAPLVTHAVYDFVAFVVLVRRPSPEATAGSGGGGPDGS